MNGQLKIESMFAFVCVDDDGTEGIPCIQSHDGQLMPLIGADMDRIDSLRPYAEELSRKLNKKVTLVHFTDRKDVEEIS